MKILMLLGGFFPPDIRVEKEARTLIRAGHEVFLLSRHKEGAPDKTVVDSINVIRVQPPEGLLRRGLEYAFFCAFFQRPFWKRILSDLVTEYHVEAIHVHDLPLVGTGLSVARQFQIPLVSDLHEMYSETVKAYGYTLPSRLLQDLRRWQQQEKRCLEYSDRIITISDGGKDFYIDKYQVSPSKLTVIMNTVDLEDFYSLPIEEEIVNKFKPYFVIAYTGTVGGPHRGIQTAISSMPKIVSHIPNARLLLVGPISKESLLQWVETDEDRTAIDKYAIFTGWQDHSLFPSYIFASNVCIIPHIISSVQTDASVPHKLFEYMAMGKPVVVSSGMSLQQIVQETGTGIVYPSGDANALAKAIIRLYEDKKLAKRLGQAGLKAVKTRYNWETEGKKLVSLYQDLCH